MQNDKFNFFVPVDFEKSGDGQSMKIAGIASTPDLDADQEMMDPHGFDLSYFLDKGFFNYNHASKSDPSSIVGEPTKAFITKKGELHLEGFLYPNSAKARDIFNLADTLKKSGSSRKLGFSIEGKVIDRDLLNPQKVTKARITGCAITPTPKNANTYLDVIKGHGVYKAPEEITYEAAPVKANGGTEYIIDVTRPDGTRIRMDKGFNITVEKAATTASAAPLIPESVDSGRNKKLKQGAVLTKSEIGANVDSNSDFLTKSQVYERIFEYTSDMPTAHKFYKLITKQSNMANQVTMDDIQKALDALGLNDDSSETLEKGMPTDASGVSAKSSDSENLSDPSGDAKKLESENLTKGDDEKDEEDEDEMEKMRGDLDEMKKGMMALTKAMTAINEKLGGSSAANGGQVTMKAVETDIEKSMADEFGETRDLIKNLATIVKGQYDEMGNMNEQLETLQIRLNDVESQPVGRKSVITKGDVLEKSYGGETRQSQSDNEQLHVAQHRAQIVKALNSLSGIEGGEYNEFYGNAVLQYEATGEISKAVRNDLATKGYDIYG